MVEIVAPPNQDEFEKLFVNNEILGKIERHLNQFNPLKVLNVERWEIRHSAVLGWLLNPVENHGLGDAFLVAFLAESFRDIDAQGHSFPNSLDIVSSDLSSAEVLVEWNRIDIFIRATIARKSWAIVVENKVDATQHSNQLKRYIDFASSQGRSNSLSPEDNGRLYAGIFLTLKDEQAMTKEYTEFNYRRVSEVLKLCLTKVGDRLSSDVQQFLNHYLETVDRLTDMDPKTTEMILLAKRLYRENKKAIDFVYAHGNSTEFGFACDLMVGSSDYEFDQSFENSGHTFHFMSQISDMFAFMPAPWVGALGHLRERRKVTGSDWKGCERWLAPYPISVYFKARPSDDSRKTSKLWIYMEVGPLEDVRARQDLIEKIKDGLEEAKKHNSSLVRLAGFRNGAKKDDAKYSKFYARDAQVKLDDIDSLFVAMQDLISGVGDMIGPITSALTEFVKQHRMFEVTGTTTPDM